MGKPLKLILNTHIFIYYMNGSKMPTRIKVAIENAKEVLLSTITSWEIFMLAKHGHITLASRRFNGMIAQLLNQDLRKFLSLLRFRISQ